MSIWILQEKNLDFGEMKRRMTEERQVTQRYAVETTNNVQIYGVFKNMHSFDAIEDWYMNLNV